MGHEIKDPGWLQCRRGALALASALVALLAGSPVAVLAASPDLSNILPRGTQRGAVTEFELVGNRLGDAAELLSYSPYFEVRELRPGGDDGKRVTATIAVADDCPLGEHQFRLRTRSGLSQLRTLWVSPYPNADEAEPNNDLESAQGVTTGHTLNGEIEREDTDFFKIELDKDELLSLEVEGMRLGQEVIDPYLALYDPEGNELASADDSTLLAQDSHLQFRAPEAGTYYVEVRDAAYDVRNTAQYRLHVGAFPRPVSANPPGASSGGDDATVGVTLDGDEAGTLDRTVPLPGASGAGELVPVYAARDGEVSPSPVYLRATPLASASESEPNNRRDDATVSPDAAPVALRGTIGTDGDSDWFRFGAKKGQSLRVVTFARTLRSPLDPVVNVYGPDGKRIEGADDTDGSPDGAFNVNIPEDGDYFLLVRDHLGLGSPRHHYHIELQPREAALAVSIPQFDRNDTQQRQFAPVPRGGRYATLINIGRQNCKGAVDLEALGLPEGVTLHARTFPDGNGQLPVVFEAAPDAPLGASFTDLVATLESEGAVVSGGFRQVLEMPRALNNNKPWRTVENDRLAVAVVEEAPFSIEVETPPVPVVQNGSLGLKVTASRREGFTAPITLRMLWKPPGIGANNTIRIPAEKNEATYTVNANGNAQTAEWEIAVLGEGDAGSGLVLASSALTRLEVGEPFLKMLIPLTSTHPGEPVDVTAKIEQLRPFEGAAKAELIGLPAHTKAEPVEITADMEEVTFRVEVAPEAPVGKHKNLFCRVHVPLAGTTVLHNTAHGGTLRIDPAPAPPEVAATGPAAAPNDSPEP